MEKENVDTVNVTMFLDSSEQLMIPNGPMFCVIVNFQMQALPLTV